MFQSVTERKTLGIYYNYNHFTALWVLSGTTRVSKCQPEIPSLSAVHQPLGH